MDDELKRLQIHRIEMIYKEVLKLGATIQGGMSDDGSKFVVVLRRERLKRGNTSYKQPLYVHLVPNE